MASSTSRTARGWTAVILVSALMCVGFYWIESRDMTAVMVAQSQSRTSISRSAGDLVRARVRQADETARSEMDGSLDSPFAEISDDKSLDLIASNFIAPIDEIRDPQTAFHSYAPDNIEIRRKKAHSLISVNNLSTPTAAARLRGPVAPGPVAPVEEATAATDLNGIELTPSDSTQSQNPLALSHPDTSIPSNFRASGKAQLRVEESPFQSASARITPSKREARLRKLAALRMSPAMKLSHQLMPDANSDKSPSDLAVMSDLRSEITRLTQLAAASNRNDVVTWCRHIQSELTLLLTDDANNQFDDQRAAELILGATEMLRAENRLTSDLELQSAIARSAYSIVRRVTVLRSLRGCQTRRDGRFISTTPINSKPVDFYLMREQIQNARDVAEQQPDALGWERFLLLDRLTNLTSSSQTDAEELTTVAKKFLERTQLQQVTPPQRKFLDSSQIQSLAATLRTFAVAPVNLDVLLRDLEQVELNSISRSRERIGDVFQTLSFAQSPSHRQLADSINTHYRNANLRFAVSESLVNRFLPQQRKESLPVSENILGARTRGDSYINTNLTIDLNPDPHKWNINLGLEGSVKSQTRSSRGPATFFNNSSAVVDTSRKIEIDTEGLRVLGQTAKVASKDSLRGFSTDFDSLPILGDLVRHIALQQFDQKRGIARRIIQRSIAKRTDSEFDRELNQQISKAETSLQENILNPLGQLELNPMVMDLSTTETRLIARYRIAGGNQLAAHTPRPIAPSDSLLSLQIHESVINNTIDQMGLGSRFWTLQELCDKLANAFQQNPWSIPADVPRDVRVKFAASRPITVGFRGGKMRLTLRIEEIEHAGKLKLDKFVISTTYIMQSNGLSTNLIQDGVVSVDGYRMGARERLPLRLIFSKIFASRQTIPIINPDIAKDDRAAGLAISQMTTRDGWLGVAVSPQKSDHVQFLRMSQLRRSSSSRVRYAEADGQSAIR